MQSDRVQKESDVRGTTVREGTFEDDHGLRQVTPEEDQDAELLLGSDRAVEMPGRLGDWVMPLAIRPSWRLIVQCLSEHCGLAQMVEPAWGLSSVKRTIKDNAGLDALREEGGLRGEMLGSNQRRLEVGYRFAVAAPPWPSPHLLGIRQKPCPTPQPAGRDGPGGRPVRPSDLQ